MDFPIVWYFEEAQARLNGKPIDIPMLYSTALILVTQGASKIYVPPLTLQERVKSAIEVLPPSLRQRVQLIDQNSSLLRRVYNFMKPLQQIVSTEKEDSAESHFVRSSIPFLYQLALAAKSGSGTTDYGISGLTHLLHTMQMNKFKGEAGVRLAILANIILSYEPFPSSHSNVRGHISRADVRRKFFDAIESAEFHDVIEKSGRVGYVRHPKTSLLKLQRSVLSLVTRPAFKGVAKATNVVSSFAGHPIPVEPLLNIAGDLAKGNSFSPPMLDLGPFQRDLYYSTISEYDQHCKPPVGAAFQIQVHEPHICGNMWAEADAPFSYDSSKVYEKLMNCHLTARRMFYK